VAKKSLIAKAKRPKKFGYETTVGVHCVAAPGRTCGNLICAGSALGVYPLKEKFPELLNQAGNVTINQKEQCI